MAHNLPEEHEIVRSEVYLNLALAALQREILLPRVFTTFDGNNFIGAPSRDAGGTLGQTLNYPLARVAAPAREYDWRRRVDPIVLDRIGTINQQITLNKHIYHGVNVTNEQMTLDIRNFAQQIVVPQIVQLREKFERYVVDALEKAPFKTADTTGAKGTVASEDTDPYLYAIRLRGILNRQGTPEEGRVLLVGDDVEAWMLTSDRLSRLQETGSTDALRRATLGNLAGFRVVRSSLIGSDEVYALHPSAILVSNLAPELPMGAPYAARGADRGMSMLITRGYDHSFQQSANVISTFMGTNSVNDEVLVATEDDVAADRAEFVGQAIFDEDGNPQVTGKNVRGTRGRIVFA